MLNRVAVATIGALAFTMPVQAETASTKPVISSAPASTSATYGNWVLRCVTLARPAAQAKKGAKPNASDKSCEVVQTVQVQGQKQPITQLAIGYRPGDKTLIMTAVLPVNVSLPGQIRILPSEDEKGAFDLTWRRCAGRACYAETKPTAKTLKPLKDGTKGSLTFQNATGRTIKIPLSWIGITQALNALENEQ